MPTLSKLLAVYNLVPPVDTFALPHEGKNNASIGIHTGAGDRILKIYTPAHDAVSIDYEHRILTWLASTTLSFEVPVPLPMRDGTLLDRRHDQMASLTTYLPGEQLDPRVPAQIELLGAALGELQA